MYVVRICRSARPKKNGHQKSSRNGSFDKFKNNEKKSNDQTVDEANAASTGSDTSVEKKILAKKQKVTDRYQEAQIIN